MNVRLAQGGGSSFDGAAAGSAWPGSSDGARGGGLRARLGSMLIALFALNLLAASSASAFEQVGIFAGSTTPVKEESFSEDVQLGGVTGMAVNYTGAGGVPAGTIYAATFYSGSNVNGKSYVGETRVARFNPDRSFSEGWEVRTKESEEEREGEGKLPYERCGPEGDPAYPNCPTRPYAVSNSPIDVEVDQTTGYVYAYNRWVNPGLTVVIVYSPDGSEVIARFGETASDSETIAESPEKVHTGEGESIAVDGAGTVYVFDRRDAAEHFYHRLMVFKPQSPGDYEHYVYAGQANDVAAGPYGTTRYPASPVADAAGFIYTDNTETIDKYDPAHPADPPICNYKFKKGGIESMTVNPLSGEVFFYSYQTRKVHRLSACKDGTFTELEAFAASPDRLLYGLAYDPVREFSPGRPAGILYGGVPGPEAFEPGQGALGFIFAPANETPPDVLSEAVSLVTQSSARLDGRVNPKGNPTRYAFQYIADAAYRANEPSERFAGGGEAPIGGGPIEGSEALAVGDQIGSLSPGTLYHFRLRAVSHCIPHEPKKECVALGAEKTFSTYPIGGLGLPDERAYELVSPIEKNGGQVFPAEPNLSSCPVTECKPGSAFNHFPMQSSPDGDAVVYEGNPFSFDVGAVIENEYIARRDPTAGWHSVNLTPARLQSKADLGFQAFKADLSEAAVGQNGFPLTADGLAGYGNLYRQSTGEPAALTGLLSKAPPNRLPDSHFDALHLSFAGASADFSRLFFRANDALTEETPVAPGAVDGGVDKDNLYEWSGDLLRLVNVDPGNATTAPGAGFGSPGSSGNEISADGSRVFWSSASGQVYVREDATATRELTDHTGKFLTASTDGSKVLLTDGCLYDLASEACQDLTQGQGVFRGVVGRSEDLSRIYFVDTAVLTGEEENGHGDKAQPGKDNLYAWAGGAPSFVATLLASEWDEARSEASPGGGWLAFASSLSLTGFDNTGPCTIESGTENFHPGPCVEVFLYRASTGDLRCASCTPSGAAPAGPSVLRSSIRPKPRYLTDSGRLFFDSQDSLSLADTNGRVEDVYEFEPDGVGTCERPAGCVTLISAGRTGVDSNFLAADPSGKNVFFTTRDQLVPDDKDELLDLYDAREGGGFPPLAGSAECQGEACLPAASPPDRSPLGSAANRGGGNPQPAKKRCPKGKVRKHSRCVKKHARKRKHHRHGRSHRKLHHDRGGAK